jgi:hypothetical protein
MSKQNKTLKGLRRGYVATLKTKVFNFGTGRHKYEVYELAGDKMDKPRFFVDADSVRMFITANESENQLVKSFENAVKRASTKSERKEMQAAKEISDLVPELETIVDANLRDSKAKRPEDTDK